MTLTVEQLSIIDAQASAVVEACPGAGKTRTIVELFLRGAASLPPRHGIAVLSFTNVAADEIEKRAAESGRPALSGYPNFVGTFDAFIARYLIAPFGSRWAPGKAVRILDSWDRIDAAVPPPRGQKSPPAPLECFRPNDAGDLVVEESRVPPAMRTLLLGRRDDWLASAKRVHRGLLGLGYLSCEDARLMALGRLRHPTGGGALVAALASRFKLLVVDEAQDSNSVDLEIVRLLNAGGIRTLIVGDPDQAIFGFRGAGQGGVAGTLAVTHRLSSNFRSASVICALASSLRAEARTDQPAGDALNRSGRVAILSYARLDQGVGATFRALVDEMQLAPHASAALAYRDVIARRALGAELAAPAGASAMSALATAVAAFRGGDIDPRGRLKAVEVVESLIAKRLGVRYSNALAASAAEAAGHDVGWLRHTASQVLGRLSSRPVKDLPGSTWTDFARNTLATIAPPSGAAFTRSAAEVLRVPAGWRLPPIATSPLPDLRALTIHQSKGREFDAVLLVLNDDSRLAATLAAWEQRSADEARRVYYVAITRARSLVAIATPSRVAERIRQLAERDGAIAELRIVAA